MSGLVSGGETLTPDICVVGAGSGGLSIAAGAAAFGTSVVLIERGRMGGDCLNYGCVPSKALIAAARRAREVRDSGDFGIVAGNGGRVDMARVREHIREVIARIAPNDSAERFRALGVRVIEAEARFLDRRTISAGGAIVRARRFVLATGSSPRIPSVPGLSELPFLTNETVFDLTEVPARLLVLGGGAIGIELAQAFHRLGSEVTVIEENACLSAEDPDLAAVVLAALEREGVELLRPCKPLRAWFEDGVLGLEVEQADGSRRMLRGSHLLVAAGRRPNLEVLDLATAGVAHDGRGVAVGSDLRSSNRRVFAIGDVAGGGHLTHLANEQAGIVLRRILFRLPARFDARKIPRAIFTDPPLGQVGLTEREARDAGLAPTLATFPFARLDRAEAERETEGFAKIVVGRRGRIIGAGLVGARADELTNLFSLAVSKGMRLRDLAAFVSPYPTFGEIGKRAATAYYAPFAGSPFVRRVVALLSRLG